MVQPEEARRALDGVGRSEDGVHRFEPVLRLFQAQQGRFHLGQQLTAFGNESLQCGFEVHARLLPQAAVGMTRGRQSSRVVAQFHARLRAYEPRSRQRLNAC